MRCSSRSPSRCWRLYNYVPAYTAFQERFAQVGLWIILIKGLLPIPYKIITIASGAAKFDFTTFVLASIVTRGHPLLPVGGFLLRLFGEAARVFIDRRLPWILAGVAVLTVVGVWMVKYV